MGTRNLTCVVKGGEYKVAQYGQWDGYPEGAGFDIADFIAGDGNIRALKSAVDLCRFVPQEVREALFSSDNECFSRDFGADILDVIVKRASKGKDIPLTDSRNFAGDSLFCEWAYVLDLDADTLEVYKGFNRNPVDPSERFASAPTDGDEYKPVRHVVTLRFDDLVAMPRDQLAKIMSGPCEEEEEL